MRKSISLLLATLLVLVFAGIAHSGTTYTFKSLYDMDKESAYAEASVRIKPSPYDITLKWKHNIIPKPSEKVMLTVKLIIEKKLTFKYARQLQKSDRGKLTITYAMKPFTFEWIRSMKPGVGGTISFKFSKTY